MKPPLDTKVTQTSPERLALKEEHSTQTEDFNNGKYITPIFIVQILDWNSEALDQHNLFLLRAGLSEPRVESRVKFGGD